MAAHPPTGPRPSSPRIVTCPQCGGDSIYAPDNPWRPFCSERCRKIDLGAWASESYRMPDKGQTDPGDTPFDETPAPR